MIKKIEEKKTHKFSASKLPMTSVFINKKTFEETIEMTKSELKSCDNNLMALERCLAYGRERADEDNDLDILFDEIEYITPFKKQFNLLKRMYKLFYVIQISILHKKLQGLLEKIEEMRPLFYQLDEMMMENCKIENDVVVALFRFREEDYIVYSTKFKVINAMLDDCKCVVENGFEFV